MTAVKDPEAQLQAKGGESFALGKKRHGGWGGGAGATEDRLVRWMEAEGKSTKPLLRFLAVTNKKMGIIHHKR